MVKYVSSTDNFSIFFCRIWSDSVSHFGSFFLSLRNLFCFSRALLIHRDCNLSNHLFSLVKLFFPFWVIVFQYFRWIIFYLISIFYFWFFFFSCNRFQIFPLASFIYFLPNLNWFFIISRYLFPLMMQLKNVIQTFDSHPFVPLKNNTSIGTLVVFESPKDHFSAVHFAFTNSCVCCQQGLNVL